MRQFEIEVSIPTWRVDSEEVLTSRGKRESQGSHGCCQTRQHWWNWAFVEVSTGVVVHLTKPVMPEASSEV